ncbi:hypothetical protein GCM10022255_069380 [Dactylosporangium darangshiense]|uniref:Uncharacterized protein n=1 Tax=Dactylosporangium darangshiense TaxID=579108 RepID=A0ABP8DI75_9ACTN
MASESRAGVIGLARCAVWARYVQGGGLTAELRAFREQLRMQAAERSPGPGAHRVTDSPRVMARDL